MEGRLVNQALLLYKAEQYSQDAFMDSYLNTQRSTIFSDAQVLIYVFDIESRSLAHDLETYALVITALKSYSPQAQVFCLVHKMDLVQSEHRERIYEDRCRMIEERSQGMSLEVFASSIWDQTLYKAWAGIVHKMIPDLSKIEKFLRSFAKGIEAEEIVLFERSTFLTVTSVDTTASGEGGEYDQGNATEDTANPNPDRFERISNIMKSYKHIVARATKGPSSSNVSAAGFVLYKVQTPTFNAFLARFTENTYISVVVPPGEAAYNCAVLNTMMAKDAFLKKTGAEG